MRYVAESPLASITGDVKRLIAGVATCDVLQEVRSRLGTADEKLTVLTGAFERLERSESELRAQVRALEASGGAPVFILNVRSAVWHKLLRDGLDMPIELWSTCCGWNHSTWPVTRRTALPVNLQAKDVCGRCITSVQGVESSGEDDDGT
jgi:hypothetical protein